MMVAPVNDQVLIEIIGVNVPGEIYLAQIAQTRNALGFLFGSAQTWQKHSRKNGDNGDDDKQFDQRETLQGLCAPSFQRQWTSHTHWLNLSLIHISEPT